MLNLTDNMKALESSRTPLETMRIRSPVPQIRRSPSPITSNSSDEEIVFTGRKNAHHLSKTTRIVPSSDRKAIGESRPEASISCINRTLQDPLVPFNESLKHVRRHETKVSSQAPFQPNPKEKRSRSRRRLTFQDEIQDDYIANLQSNGEPLISISNLSLSKRDIGGLDGSHSDGEVFDAVAQQDEGWDSTDLKDFEGLSTSSEEFEKVDRIMARRGRPSGRQYLVVGVGFAVDDARWLPFDSLAKSEQLLSLIRKFDEEEAKSDQTSEVDSPTDSLAEEELVQLDVLQAVDDAKLEKARHERHMENITDEQLARLLIKQEVFGMGSNDLILWDGGEDEIAVGARSNRNPSSQTSRRKNKKQTFPVPPKTARSRGINQDTSEELDCIVPWEIKVHRRYQDSDASGRFDLLDSDLEKKLQIAWGKDRKKKRARKEAREELRAQGRLGKKRSNTPDLKAKYYHGITLENVEAEVKKFLTSSSAEALSLPPMHANARKVIHEIGHRLSLKTKSKGSGKSRFPILYKTSRTGKFDERAFVSIRRKNFPSLGQGRKQGAPAGVFHEKAGQNASYRDGEVIGAFAPEIGQENRGRAMLEKMGWSSGTALGASNNKGIAVPVEQVVKINKSGLG